MNVSLENCISPNISSLSLPRWWLEWNQSPAPGWQALTFKTEFGKLEILLFILPDCIRREKHFIVNLQWLRSIGVFACSFSSESGSKGLCNYHPNTKQIALRTIFLITIHFIYLSIYVSKSIHILQPKFINIWNSAILCRTAGMNLGGASLTGRQPDFPAGEFAHRLSGRHYDADLRNIWNLTFAVICR